MDLVRTHKAKVHELDNVEHSRVQLSNHTRSEAKKQRLSIITTTILPTTVGTT